MATTAPSPSKMARVNLPAPGKAMFGCGSFKLPADTPS